MNINTLNSRHIETESDLCYPFNITEFRFERSYTNGLEAFEEDILFDIRGHFVISEFNITEVDCRLIQQLYYGYYAVTTIELLN